MPYPFYDLYRDDALQARIARDIASHRQSEACLTLLDAHGQPMPGAHLTVMQTGTDFLFGANLFLLDGYRTPAENERYEQAFTRLFNAATVPFYWKDLEPAPGQLRFAAGSAPIYRRPPPDVVVAFCETHGLNMNGHCLAWDNMRHSVPEWFRTAPNREVLLEKRIREIAEHYGKRIPRWDILNEPVGHRCHPNAPDYPMPPDYEHLAFQAAGRYLPLSAHQMINETTQGAWRPDLRPRYHELIRELRARGARIDGIGLQWHCFSMAAMEEVFRGEAFAPQEMLAALDEYIPFDAPLHISEITLHALQNDAAGQQAQADYARLVYRLWFSHPAVHAITWWNVPDGGAVPGEDSLFSGLLNKDLSPKPAYDALYDLIHHELRTQTAGETDAHGHFRMRGFHGTYRVTIAGHETHTIHIRPGLTTHTIHT